MAMVRGYKKFGNTLQLSYSTVSRVIQRFSKMGFTQNRTRKGWSKKLSPCAVRQMQKLASKNRCKTAASIALEVKEAEGQLVSAQTIHHNKSVCMAVIPERSFFWSWLTKKPANSLLKTTLPRTWITGTMSCGLMRLRYTCLAQRWCPACVTTPWWGVPKKLCLAYSQAWWW